MPLPRYAIIDSIPAALPLAECRVCNDDAARVGCRVAVVEGKSTGDVTTSVTSYLAAARVSGTTTTLKVNGASADASTAQAQDEITVSVTVPVRSVTWLSGGKYADPNTILTGRFSMRRE